MSLPADATDVTHIPVIDKLYNILTLSTLNSFCKNNGEQSFFQFEITINVLVSSFCIIYLILVSLRLLKILFFAVRGQNLTSSLC